MTGPGKPAASVTDRRLVLDANIIVRAVLGNRVRELIERFCTEVQMLAPATAFAEVEEHLPLIYAKRGLSADLAMGGIRTCQRHCPRAAACLPFGA